VAALILVVEDDPQTARALAKAVTSSGYRVAIAESASEARSILGQVQPDLILLDLGLPDTDGLILTTAFKKLTNAPIIICSARHGQVDRVLGLKLGADDFIAKPFDLEDLEARIAAVLRRASRMPAEPAVPADEIRVGDLRIVQTRGTVLLAGRSVRLTQTEYRLLVALASHPAEILSRETLGTQIWGFHDAGTGHLIDVHIGRLRLKLRRALPDASVVVTVRGKGYTVGSAPP
jgi:DNA-binding response OmpR family regulator